VSIGRILAVSALVVAVFFWTWALFFASKEAVNKIDDRAWAARAEEICAEAKEELAEFDNETSEDIQERSLLVVRSTDILSGMLDQVVAVQPTDEKGQAIVPRWEEEYRQLLDDRYAYAEQLAAGDDGPFTETAVRGIPITERIETFAGDNEMPSCAPPRGSII
jgi:hypothetical protein